MKLNHKTNKAARGGLTLIELVVVLVILVALAGLLLPLFPSMLDRAHTSTTSSNITEVSKSIQLFEAMNLRQPSNFDSMVSAEGNTLRADNRFTVVEIDGAAGTLPRRIRDALVSAGITRSWEMTSGVDNFTAAGVNSFDPYTGVTYDLSADGSPVALLGAEPYTPGPDSAFSREIERLGLRYPLPLGTAEGSDPVAYAMFGVGAQSDMIGNTMQQAPVHFPEGGGLDPTRTYARFVAVYAIPAEGPARLATVAAVHGNHLDSFEDLVGEYYELVQSPQN